MKRNLVTKCLMTRYLREMINDVTQFARYSMQKFKITNDSFACMHCYLKDIWVSIACKWCLLDTLLHSNDDIMSNNDANKVNNTNESDNENPNNNNNNYWSNTDWWNWESYYTSNNWTILFRTITNKFCSLISIEYINILLVIYAYMKYQWISMVITIIDMWFW